MANVPEKFQVIYNYVTLEFKASERGGYDVSVPAAPGCRSHGDTFKKALETILADLEAWLIVSLKIDLVIADELLPMAGAIPEELTRSILEE